MGDHAERSDTSKGLHSGLPGLSNSKSSSVLGTDAAIAQSVSVIPKYDSYPVPTSRTATPRSVDDNEKENERHDQRPTSASTIAANLTPQTAEPPLMILTQNAIFSLFPRGYHDWQTQHNTALSSSTVFRTAIADQITKLHEIKTQRAPELDFRKTFINSPSGVPELYFENWTLWAAYLGSIDDLIAFAKKHSNWMTMLDREYEKVTKVWEKFWDLHQEWEEDRWEAMEPPNVPMDENIPAESRRDRITDEDAIPQEDVKSGNRITGNEPDQDRCEATENPHDKMQQTTNNMQRTNDFEREHDDQNGDNPTSAISADMTGKQYQSHSKHSHDLAALPSLTPKSAVNTKTIVSSNKHEPANLDDDDSADTEPTWAEEMSDTLSALNEHNRKRAYLHAKIVKGNASAEMRAFWTGMPEWIEW